MQFLKSIWLNIFGCKVDHVSLDLFVARKYGIVGVLPRQLTVRVHVSVDAAAV